MRGLTRGALATVPLVLALALTGCGSGAGADAGGADKAGASSVSPDEMAVKFAQCLREHGIDVPDPEPGKGVQIKIDKSVAKEKVDKAMEACRKYSPEANGSPNPEMDEKGRKFAQCMRDNGVENFADPAPGQRGIRIDGKVAQDPDFKKAQEKCQEILSGGSAPGAK